MAKLIRIGNSILSTLSIKSVKQSILLHVHVQCRTEVDSFFTSISIFLFHFVLFQLVKNTKHFVILAFSFCPKYNLEYFISCISNKFAYLSIYLSLYIRLHLPMCIVIAGKQRTDSCTLCTHFTWGIDYIAKASVLQVVNIYFVAVLSIFILWLGFYVCLKVFVKELGLNYLQ